MSEFVPFRFNVTLYSQEYAEQSATQEESAPPSPEAGEVLCAGAFSEVTGLEVNVEPKAIREGGRNWGELQRSGPAKFATVVLKRGVTTLNDLWKWFDATTRGANYSYRMQAVIEVIDGMQDDQPHKLMKWTLENALPVKFKGPDLSSTANQVAIEELHLVHEGLSLERPVQG